MAALPELVAGPPVSSGYGYADEKNTITVNCEEVLLEAWQDTLKHNEPQIGKDDSHIVSSPYTEKPHQLDLRTLDLPLQLFATALTRMTAVRADYATAPYDIAFNWGAITGHFVELLKKTHRTAPEKVVFYVIVFRSRLNHSANRPLLGELDKAAHLEAVDSGGLMKYWFGTPDQNRRNLATCLWRDRTDARLGGAGPGHSAAMQAARLMYDEWFVERLRLSVDVKTASWSFREWSDEDELQTLNAA